MFDPQIACGTPTRSPWQAMKHVFPAPSTSHNAESVGSKLAKGEKIAAEPGLSTEWLPRHVSANEKVDTAYDDRPAARVLARSKYPPPRSGRQSISSPNSQTPPSTSVPFTLRIPAQKRDAPELASAPSTPISPERTASTSCSIIVSSVECIYLLQATKGSRVR